MKTVSLCSSNTWDNVSTKVNRAVVFIDNESAEVLHWNGGLDRLVHNGAVDVKEFSSFESAEASQKKGVFITSSPLFGMTCDILKDIIQACHFQYVIVITAVTPQAHALIQGRDPENSSFFESLEEEVLEWMNNMNYTCEVIHEPIMAASFSSHLFVTPAFTDLFPILSSDVDRIRLQYNSRTGEKKVIDSIKGVEFFHLPKNLQVLYKLFVSSLNGLLEDLDVTEDCYFLGQTSRILASELASYPPARSRRKTAQNKASILLVDRTLDLADVSSYHTETLLDKIINLLPRLPGHNNDVNIDMSSLCKVHRISKEVILPGCLSSVQSSGGVQSHLTSMMSFKQKEALMDINRQLVEAASRENLPLKLTGRPGRVTAESLDSTIMLFKGLYPSIMNHLDTLQVSMATSQMLKHPACSVHEKICQEEKLLIQNIGMPDSSSFLSHLLLLLGEDPKSRNYSLDEILTLLVYGYSVINLEDIDEEEEDMIKTKVLDEILKTKDSLPPLVQDIMGPSITQEIVSAVLDDVFEKLAAIGTVRQEFSQFRSVVEVGSVMSPSNYKPLLKQITEIIFDPSKPEIKDIEQKSTGFTDLLKSGFGLFRSVTSKPRPSDHPLLIVYVVGGITTSEVKHIRDTLSQLKPSTEVVIGSTRLVTPGDVVRAVLSQDNINPSSFLISQ